MRIHVAPKLKQGRTFAVRERTPRKAMGVADHLVLSCTRIDLCELPRAARAPSQCWSAVGSILAKHHPLKIRLGYAICVGPERRHQ